MARECGGCTVELDKVPLKYPGLEPWQIWVSESQERMTLSVPSGNFGNITAGLIARRIGLPYKRIIAATNRDLEEAIKNGIFREDLFYRLNVISIIMPSLSKRKEDIPLLAEHFLHRFVQETNKIIDKISREAMDELMLYDWPGNVRELENAIERAVVVGKDRQMLPEDLPILCYGPFHAPQNNSLKEVEKNHIQQILTDNDWNIARSAKILGIDRSTLYSKIKKYEIEKT